MPKGAVIYVRVSTAEQASSNQSLPVQESKARAFCQQRGLAVLKLFADKGESARTDDRPEFKKLMTYCRQHRREISHVIVSDLSRLARNVLDQGQTIVGLTEMGIELVSVDEPNLDDSAAGRLLKNVLGSMNQFFSDSLSEKTKDRMTAGVKQGRWLWVAPLGYRNETKTKTVVIDSERAPLIRKAFELVDEKDFGHAFKIVRSLGLTTRSGRPIPKQSLSFLLRNEFYAGQIVSKSLRIKGNHEPLVSEELFQRVRAKLHAGVPHQAEHEDFPLRGTMICMKCRRPLTAGWAKGRGKKYARYWCWTKDCKAISGSKEEIESNFVMLLGFLKPNAEILAQLPMIAARQWESRSESITTESKSLVRRLEEQRSLKLKAIEARVKCELAVSDFEPLKGSIEQEITRIEAAMASLDAERASYAELMSQTKADVLDFAKAWSEGSTRRKREIQKAIFPNGLPFSVRRRKSGDFEPSNVIKGQPFESIFDALRPIGVPDGI